MNCPTCNTVLKRVLVAVEGAKRSVLTYSPEASLVSKNLNIW